MLQSMMKLRNTHKLSVVIPSAIEANVKVNLKLKDLGSKSRSVYGKIKASVTEYKCPPLQL